MSYKLTNISGGQIVCDLAIEGNTLRLDNKKTKTIKDNEITPHILNMSDKKLILIEKLNNEVKSVKKETVKKKSNSKEKEE